MVREMLRGAPTGVSLDALLNTLKERGFRRPPGSLRLITRLRRIKALEVGRDNSVRLALTGPEETGVEPARADDALPVSPSESSEESAPGSGNGRRRRRRRGGRRRRRRGQSQAPVVEAP